MAEGVCGGWGGGARPGGGARGGWVRTGQDAVRQTRLLRVSSGGGWWWLGGALAPAAPAGGPGALGRRQREGGLVWAPVDPGCRQAGGGCGWGGQQQPRAGTWLCPVLCTPTVGWGAQHWALVWGVEGWGGVSPKAGGAPGQASPAGAEGGDRVDLWAGAGGGMHGVQVSGPSAYTSVVVRTSADPEDTRRAVAGVTHPERVGEWGPAEALGSPLGQVCLAPWDRAERRVARLCGRARKHPDPGRVPLPPSSHCACSQNSG